MSRKIRIDTVVHGDRLFVIVTNPFAGRRNRYTVHQAHLGDWRGSKIIGRELPLHLARKIVREKAAR